MRIFQAIVVTLGLLVLFTSCAPSKRYFPSKQGIYDFPSEWKVRQRGASTTVEFVP